MKDRVALVALGGGNLVGNDGSTLVGNDGSTLVGNDGSTLVGLDGGSLVGNDGSTLIGNDGSTSPFSFLSLKMNHATARADNPTAALDADSDETPRRDGWYAFRDAEGKNGKLGTTTDADGNVTLRAQLDLNQNTLPRTQDINRTRFGIVLDPSYLNFAESSYTVAEGAGKVNVTVRRSNNLDGSAVVLYQTTSQAAPEFGATAGAADDRKDYTPVFGTLLFAPGETEKTFSVSITDDGLGGADDGAQETFNILLNNANGAIVDGTGSVRVTINDNDTANAATNPVRDSQFFVRQHYRDFLSREPDQAGLDFWTNGIESCGANAQCRAAQRANTSAAFFLSIEFQQTGFLVSRVAAATFGQTPARPKMQEFLISTQAIGSGVVIGQEGWQQKLAANRQAFLDAWAQRPDFLALYAGKTNEQYVSALLQNAGATASDETELRAQLVAGLNAGTETRATALLKIVESRTVFNKQFNPALVRMQYIGYLRRNPNDAPDANFDGFNFWLSKLNSFSRPEEDMRDAAQAFERVKRAEMVRAFIESIEYERRFGK